MKIEKTNPFDIPKKYLEKSFIKNLKGKRNKIYLLKDKEETDMFCSLRLKNDINAATDCMFVQEYNFTCKGCFFFKNNLKHIHSYFKKYIDNENR